MITVAHLEHSSGELKILSLPHFHLMPGNWLYVAVADDLHLYPDFQIYFLCYPFCLNPNPKNNNNYEYCVYPYPADISCLANSVNPDKLASSEAN